MLYEFRVNQTLPIKTQTVAKKRSAYVTPSYQFLKLSPFWRAARTGGGTSAYSVCIGSHHKNVLESRPSVLYNHFHASVFQLIVRHRTKRSSK